MHWCLVTRRMSSRSVCPEGAASAERWVLGRCGAAVRVVPHAGDDEDESGGSYRTPGPATRRGHRRRRRTGIPALPPLPSRRRVVVVVPIPPGRWLRRAWIEERGDVWREEEEEEEWKWHLGLTWAHYFLINLCVKLTCGCLLFFRIELTRKRHVNATSDEDRVKLATQAKTTIQTSNSEGPNLHWFWQLRDQLYLVFGWRMKIEFVDKLRDLQWTYSKPA